MRAYENRPYSPLAIDPSHLLLAIPKKGRLYDRSIQLLSEIGLQFKRTQRSDIAHCITAPVSLVFLNVVDIPVFVAEGNVDGGIAGQDVIAETGRDLPNQQLLGFGRCTLAVQAPIQLHLKPKDLIGKRVVTSFPRLAKQYFELLEQNRQDDENGIIKCHNGAINGLVEHKTAKEKCANGTKTVYVGAHTEHSTTRIFTVSGSVEASVSLGLSEGVIDLVETGDTMRIAGLEQIGVVMESEAVFISNPNTRHQAWLTTIKKRIEGYLTAQHYQMVTYNITRDKLQQAIMQTPGLRSPTITNLADANWISITAVVERSQVLDVIDRLDLLGAQDVLTYDFKHCRFGSSLHK